MEVIAGFKQSELGPIPTDWAVSRFDDFADVDPEALGSNTPRDYVFDYISLEGVDNGLLKETSQQVFGSAPSRARRVVRQGDVLLGTVRPNLRSHLYVGHDCKNVICSTGFSVVRCRNERADPRFVFFHLFASAVSKQIEALVTGSNYPAISASDVRALKIPLPRICEQQTIATALSDVDALLLKLDQLIAKKRDLRLGAMQELLTGQTRLPGFSGQWQKLRLGDVGAFSKGAGIKKNQVLQEGIPCIRYGELYTHHNDYVRRFYSFISPEIARESRVLHRGDLLFAGSGETAEEIGKCVAFLSTGEAYAGGDIVIFSPRHQDSMYLGYLMNHPSVVAQKARMGQGDAIVHIGARNLASLEVTLPEFAEQVSIAAVISEMDTDISTLVARRDKTLMVKQGMMQELLTGRIRLV